MKTMYFRTAADAAEKIAKINREFAVPEDASDELKKLSENIRNRYIIPVVLDALRIRVVRSKTFTTAEYEGNQIPVNGISWLANGGRIKWHAYGDKYQYMDYDVDEATANELHAGMKRIREVAAQLAAHKNRPATKVVEKFSIAQAFEGVEL